jgi:hypothetical protein
MVTMSLEWSSPSIHHPQIQFVYDATTPGKLVNVVNGATQCDFVATFNTKLAGSSGGAGGAGGWVFVGIVLGGLPLYACFFFFTPFFLFSLTLTLTLSLSLSVSVSVSLCLSVSLSLCLSLSLSLSRLHFCLQTCCSMRMCELEHMWVAFVPTPSTLRSYMCVCILAVKL